MSNATETETWASSPVAICLSGGGYRAAGFHLGTLAYLQRVGLLKNVCSISTISGGTFTGAAYALSLAEHRSFESFYARFSQQLVETHLVKRALGHLADAAPNPSGRRNIIVCMAEVYANTFFAKESGGPYLLKDIFDAGDQIPDVSLNATEFRTGLAFRFQNRKRARIGNDNVSISREPAGDVRVADVVAASSCFPGGFEPLAFPDDFVWPDGRIPQEVTNSLTKNGLPQTIALMDGGIYDNQGASSLDLAVHRDADSLSMFIISDVDQESDDIYPFPTKAGLSGLVGRLTLSQVRLALWSVYAVSALSVVALATQLFRQVGAGSFSIFPDFFLYVVPLTLSGLTVAALRAVHNALADVLHQVPQTDCAAWNDLKGVTVNQFVEMGYLRVSSLFKMASTVFMKRIRSLVYSSIYRDPRYQKKRIANLIYELDSDSPPRKDLSAPSQELRKLAVRTAAMPTALWFDNTDQLLDLVACGQATICYNLIKLIEERFGDPAGYPADVSVLCDRLTDDWDSLGANPKSLLPEWRDDGG